MLVPFGTMFVAVALFILAHTMHGVNGAQEHLPLAPRLADHLSEQERDTRLLHMDGVSGVPVRRCGCQLGQGELGCLLKSTGLFGEHWGSDP